MVKAAEENETMTEQIIRLKKAKGKVEMKMKEKKVSRISWDIFN